MKLFASLSMLILANALAKDAYPPLNLGEINKPVYCSAPSQPFFEQKLRESFHFSAGEKELKDVVLDSRNYPEREEIKSLRRKLSFAGRLDRSLLLPQISSSFDKMIETTKRRDPISNFPIEGSSSVLSASEEGTMMITMDNVVAQDLDFIPPAIREKIGSTVKVHYNYPYDKFHYVLTYDGKEMHMDKALFRIQDEFEDACVRRALDNRFERKKREGSSASGTQGM